MSQKLSFRTCDQSNFLLKSINSANRMSVPKTKRSSGLPASSPPPVKKRLGNHIPTGLDPLMSIQIEGIHRVMEVLEGNHGSRTKSLNTRTKQPVRAKNGDISLKELLIYCHKETLEDLCVRTFLY